MSQAALTNPTMRKLSAAIWLLIALIAAAALYVKFTQPGAVHWLGYPYALISTLIGLQYLLFPFPRLRPGFRYSVIVLSFGLSLVLILVTIFGE